MRLAPTTARQISHAPPQLARLGHSQLKTNFTEAVRKFLAAGKPVIGIRTASHAFDAKGKLAEGQAVWSKFDAEVLGGNYSGHHGANTMPTVKTIQEAEKHPTLIGVQTPFSGHGSLYKVSPLAKSATALLTGSIPNQSAEPVAWINQYGKAHVFYTSLGYIEDFDNPSFRHLLLNGIFWAMERAIPEN